MPLIPPHGEIACDPTFEIVTRLRLPGGPTCRVAHHPGAIQPKTPHGIEDENLSMATPSSHHDSAAPMRSPHLGFTLVELLVAIGIIGLLLGILLPAVQATREAARTLQCSNNLKQVALAVLAYEMQNGAFPAATNTTDKAACQDCFDPWFEASRAPGSFTPGTKHGTSWILSVLPFMEQKPLADKWDWQTNVRGNAALAQIDIPLLYCPSRRSGIRTDFDDHLSLVDPAWRGGGNDYGGCYGRLDGFENDVADDHRFRDMSAATVTPQLPTPTAPQVAHDSGLLDGLFHATQRRTAMAAGDGLSNVILLGEMQRLRPAPGATGAAASNRTSQNGWAVGGVATLFNVCTDPQRSNPGGLNNLFFESPGSDHEGGANFAMGDGSVRFVSEFVDAKDNAAVLPLLGSIQDGGIASIDQANP